jgi:hypothetical protein
MADGLAAAMDGRSGAGIAPRPVCR